MILHVIDALYPGGAERVLVELVNALDAAGLQVGVCVTREGVDLADELRPGIAVEVLGRQSRWDVQGLRSFAKYCRRNRVTIIHAHGRSSATFVALARLLLPRRIRLVMHDHNGRDVQVTPLLGLISRHLYHAYVCVSEGLYTWALSRLALPPEKCLILANAIDVSRFTTQPRFDDKKPLKGVLLANLRPEKSHLLVLDAVAGSPTLRENMRLAFVGSGLESEQGRLIVDRRNKLGLEGVVSIDGGRRSVETVLAEADFGLVASRVEAGPVVSLEYMAAGLPFVTTRTGQVAGLTEGQGVCLVVPPGDMLAMRQALEELVETTSSERQVMGVQGRAFLEQHFGLSKQVQRLIRLYAHVLPAGEERDRYLALSGSAQPT